jgi:hypothetical protein
MGSSHPSSVANAEFRTFRMVPATSTAKVRCAGTVWSLCLLATMRPPVLLALALSIGCGIAPAEEAARREALAVEGRALEHAVACRVGDVHFQDMARLFEEQAEKGRGKRRVREWATADDGAPGMGGPRVPLVDVR